MLKMRIPLTDNEDTGFELLSACLVEEVKFAGLNITLTPVSIFFNGTDRDLFYDKPKILWRLDQESLYHYQFFQVLSY